MHDVSPLLQLIIIVVSNTELPDNIKDLIYGRALAGQTDAEIATAEQLPRSTIKHVIERIKQRNTATDDPHTGRHKTYDDCDARKINDTGLNLGSDTLRTILNDHDVINWRCKKRPSLTAHHARLRLQ